MYHSGDIRYGDFGHNKKRRTFGENRIINRKKKIRFRWLILILSFLLLCFLVVVLVFSMKSVDTSSLERIDLEIADNEIPPVFEGQVTEQDYLVYLDEINKNNNPVEPEIYIPPEESIDIGDEGVMGSTLHIENINTEWIIDTSAPEKPANESAVSVVDIELPATNRPVSVIGVNASNRLVRTDKKAYVGKDFFGPAITKEQLVQIKNKIHSQENPSGGAYKPAVTEYISADKSEQSMNYIVYAPENADESTPIFIFLHGIGSNGAAYTNFITTYSFLKYLIAGSWSPNVIIVAPIQNGGGNWATSGKKIRTIISEVINAYGGNWDNLYISGFSAGANGVTPIAKEIQFKGAIYIGGYLGGINNTMDVDSFLRLWEGKSVYYYRENLWHNIGYGYESAYVNACLNYASAYNVDFIQVDMNWEHLSGVVDATFLPGRFKDNKDQICHNGIESLIYH